MKEKIKCGDYVEVPPAKGYESCYDYLPAQVMEVTNTTITCRLLYKPFFVEDTTLTLPYDVVKPIEQLTEYEVFVERPGIVTNPILSSNSVQAQMIAEWCCKEQDITWNDSWNVTDAQEGENEKID